MTLLKATLMPGFVRLSEQRSVALLGLQEGATNIRQA